MTSAEQDGQHENADHKAVTLCVSAPPRLCVEFSTSRQHEDSRKVNAEAQRRKDAEKTAEDRRVTAGFRAALQSAIEYEYRVAEYEYEETLEQ